VALLAHRIFLSGSRVAEVTTPAGTVNLFGRVIGLQAIGQVSGLSGGGKAAEFYPDAECLRSGG
jgi:hypothetical protein